MTTGNTIAQAGKTSIQLGLSMIAPWFQTLAMLTGQGKLMSSRGHKSLCLWYLVHLTLPFSTFCGRSWRYAASLLVECSCPGPSQ